MQTNSLKMFLFVVVILLLMNCEKLSSSFQVAIKNETKYPFKQLSVKCGAEPIHFKYTIEN